MKTIIENKNTKDTILYTGNLGGTTWKPPGVLIAPIKFVGKYCIGTYANGGVNYNGISICLYKKPSFIHRFFMQKLLGIYWYDNQN